MLYEFSLTESLSALILFVTSLLEMLLRFITVPDVIAAVKSFIFVLQLFLCDCVMCVVETASHLSI